MSAYGTPFQETEALLAMQDENVDVAEAILRDMLPGELDDLTVACTALREMAVSMARIKRRSRADG